MSETPNPAEHDESWRDSMDFQRPSSGNGFGSTQLDIRGYGTAETGELIFPDALTYEDWDEIGIQLAQEYKGLQRSALYHAMHVGQWMDRGLERYGEMASQAKAIADAVEGSAWKLSPKTVQEYLYLWRRFGTNPLVFGGTLSIQHLNAVRKCEDEDAAVYLEQASESQESAGDLKKRVREDHPAAKRKPVEAGDTNVVSPAYKTLLEDFLAEIEERGAPKWLQTMVDRYRARLEELSEV